MKIAICAILMGLSAHVFGESSSGCGLGWKFTKSMTTSGSATRNSTHFTSSNTLAMTSGTSGCDFHQIVKNEKSKIHFVESNMLPLQLESAIGSGERLVAALKIFGCHEENLEHFSRMIRNNHSRLFIQKSDARDFVDSIEGLIHQDSLLKEDCTTST